MAVKDDILNALRDFGIPLIFIIVAFLLGTWNGQRMFLDSQVDTRDTVTKYVTVYKEFPDPVKTVQTGYIAVPKYKFFVDTVEHPYIVTEYVDVHDTTVIYLPREQKYYEEEEGHLRMWVSGYQPQLDRYEVDWKETQITNTIHTKPSRWGFGLILGGGIGYYDKKVIATPLIGGGITYTIFWF